MTNYELHDLKSMVQQCNLVDLQSVGYRLTWMNGMVSYKLDWALVCSQWLLEDFHSYAEFLPLGCFSNHSCCVIMMLHDEYCERRSFKFYNMWTLHESF